MKENSFSCLKIVLICSVVMMMIFGFTAIASATNGYLPNGHSVKSKAMGGAGVALPMDSLAAADNPAGMVHVGNQIYVGIAFFNPNREYTVRGNPTDPSTVPGCPPACPFGLAPGNVDSDTKWFLIPSIGANWMIDNDSSIGISIYGHGGMNTDYDTNTFNLNPMLPSFGSEPTGVDLMQLFVVPTYARKLNSKHSIGISPVFAYQAFEAQGLQAFGEAGFSSDPSNLSNNGHDSSYGYGAKIGYLGEVLPNVFLGASYQTKVYMSEFDGYAGLFAEQGDFDIPSHWTVGLAVKLSSALTFAFDVQQIYYTDVDSINNPFLPNLMTSQLGDDKGAGFGWEDMTVVKTGIQWESSPEWTWRAGYSISDNPIPSTEVMFNIIAPGVIEQHASVGFTRKLGSNHELDLAVTRAFSNDVEGPNPLDPAQTIELKMDQWEIALGYTYKF